MSGNADRDLCTHPKTTSTLKPEGVLENRCWHCGQLLLSAYVPADERGYIRTKLEEAVRYGDRR